MPIKEQVLEYLNGVRRRWRLATIALGVAITGVAALVLTVLAVLGANIWRFSDRAVVISRSVLLLATAAVIVRYLVRPLWQRLSDARLARFVEEKNPHLRDRLVTAVHLGEQVESDHGAKLFHDVLAQDALRQTSSIPPHAIIERHKIWRPLLWGLGSLALILVLGFFGPGIFRYGTGALWVGWAQAKSGPLYQLQVLPGDVTVGRNTDEEVTARPFGFLPNAVRIFVLYQSNPNWESATMVPQERGGAFRFLLTNVREPIEYYAEASGVRSPHYRISVIDVPHVSRLEIRYHYPAYTGMKDTVEPSGGDIVALRGTQVTLIAHTNLPATGGRMVLDDGSNFSMKKLGENELQATLAISKDALYHIRLQDHLGREAKASEEYVIQALTDAPPTLKITRPGHDLQPNPIEEVVIGMEAQDDVRMGELQLHYSVNGSPEQTVSLARGGLAKEVSGSHTLPLEEFHLVPGDVVSFYGVAKDAASNTSKTEMFFLEVRPFERNYTQAQTGGGGAGGGDQNTFLSEKQKQVISATWNVIRKQGQQKPEQVAAQAQVLSSVERTLRQQAENLAERTAGRELAGVNDEFKGLVDNLKQAAEAMEPAAGLLEKQKFQEALAPEQTALQHLMRAEALFRDIQVAFGSSGGGGGGGASRDLADLFALELDTGKNQYETLQQMGDNDNKAAADDAMRKLEELARRQEDLSRREQEKQKDSLTAASRWEQEMLRREAEELAKKLEQLSRETNSSRMGQAANALSQAARDMQQAANQQGQGQSGSNGSSERARAEQRLREAGNLVSGQQNQWNEDTVRRLAENAEQMAREQQKIADDVLRAAQGQLGQEQSSQQGNQGRDRQGLEQGLLGGNRQNSRVGAEREALQRLLEQKQNLLESLNSLEKQINEAAGNMAGNQKKTAQQLRGASSYIQDERMADKIRQGAFLEQRGLFPMASPGEEDLRAGMENLAERLKDAQQSLGQKGAEDKLQEALNLAERVRQGLESLERQRMGEQGPGNQAGDRGSQQGQQDNQNRERQGGNQPGNRGDQQGQRGQQSQQGQGQQGQGQQGQQGQGQQGQGQSGQQAGRGQGQGQQGNQEGNGRGEGQASASTYGGQSGNSSTSNGGGFRGGNLNLGTQNFVPLTPEELKQLAQRFQELTTEASGLRSLVSDDKELGKLAQELVAAMENFNREQFGAKAADLERMTADLIDRWKELELRLARRLGGDASDAVRLARQERVPERYRAILEEYYRLLGRSPR